MSIKITKNSDLLIPKNVSENTFNSDAYGTEYTIDSYESNISVTHTTENDNYKALKNVFNLYKLYSPEFNYSNYKTSTTCFINIPSVFYGSEIKKGSVEINYYVTGTLVGQLTDANQRGELRQTLPVDNQNKIAGVCMYKHGVILLTGSWEIGTNQENFDGTIGNEKFQWKYFNRNAESTTSSSYDLKFEGTTYTPSIMVYTYADKGQLNHSNNPTSKESQSIATSSFSITENNLVSYVNTVKSDFTNTSESFEKQTFIDSIGLYDENKNLIAVAKLSKPIRKTEERDFAFKLKLDL